jgi:NADH-quinone oxidoreductase subunit N
MNGQQLIGLLPLLALAGAALLVLLVAAFVRSFTAAFVVSLVGLVGALACIGVAWPLLPFEAGALLSFDGFAFFGITLIVTATIFVAIGAWSYLKGRGSAGGEFYFLLLLASLGACVLAAAASFATFFLGLELLSVSLYALIAWQRDRAASTEAAIKYLILAGASSAFLLFGMALVYAETGAMALSRLAEAVTGTGAIAPVGLAMMLVGVGFKLAVVPFHMWTPDIYDGAPAPVTGYIATVSKGAMMVVLVRALAPALIGPSESSAAFPIVFGAIAGLSMFAGNLLALRESNVKRILAYSSIAHLGYLLVAFVAGGPLALRAISFYLVAYFATTLGAFAIVGELSRDLQSERDGARDADRIEDYRGLSARRPWLTFAFTAMLLSLAGLPLTAGFIGKFIILRAGVGAELWVLAVILAVNGTISIFYYLKIVSAMFRPAKAAGAPARGAARVPLLAAVALAILALAVVALGVVPSPMLSFLDTLATSGM